MAQDTNQRPPTAPPAGPGGNGVTIKALLEAGAHFGHQTSRWNPHMKPFIFTQRNGIHIIDLQQTMSLLQKACAYVRETVANGGTILFVGTKKQAQEAVQQEATRCGAFYVNQRWLGGMLTNFATIQARIDYLVRLEDRKVRGELSHLPKKEAQRLDDEIVRLNRTMGGFKEMTALPGAVFIVDPTKERIAIAECKRVGVPIVAMVDTNCNPDEIDYPVPCNDDAIRAIRLICSRIADAVLEGKAMREGTTPDYVAEKPAEGVKVEAAPPTLSFSPEDQAPQKKA
ncbi:MAG: 30S ribosomal protein S2 [Chloroflexi bacterium]|nr:30S ribosomal protein S2 [Chloroflexota bacterium]